PVDTRRIAGLDLDRYNVIILPSGSYASTLGTAGLNRLRDWVRGGGALIALEGAVSLLEHKELGLRTAVEAAKDADSLTVADTLLSVTAAPGPFTSPSAVGNREAMWVPGAIARASMDPTHWLRWGYRDDALAVMLPDEFLPASRTGENVVIFDEASEVLAGFTWPGNTDVHLPGTVWATVEGFGRGSVIAFAGNPL